MPHDFESPFLDADFSRRERAPDGEPRASAPSFESPFLSGESGERVTSFAMHENQAPPKRDRIRARILWPALGFPAVIAPREGHGRDTPLKDGDATRCVTVLLLSDRTALSKEEAARYLRVVKWDVRETRHLSGEAGSFKEEELEVRNEEGQKGFSAKLTVPTEECDRKDPAPGCLGDVIVFGGNGESERTITVNLARCVSSFYRNQKLKHLHEIRISEEASNRLADGQYNLFWNNEVPGEKAPSDEMRLLLDQFAGPRRRKLSEVWQSKENRDYLMDEYEFEYGVNHKPYFSSLAIRRPRTEVLHPLFVDRKREKAGVLKIGHLTDTHVDVRVDVYEENLAEKRPRTAFSNYNRNFISLYKAAKQESNAILITGDLIDYGRGHVGISARDRLAEDEAYHVDRNWFLFYYLLAAGESYTRPVYTNLGNHDWRLNPYPPFASGAPNPASLAHDFAKFNRKKPANKAGQKAYDDAVRDQKNMLIDAHGDGHELLYSYSSDALAPLDLLKEDQDPKKRLENFKAVWGMFLQRKTLDVPGFPTETTVDSVAWYLMSINPFLDYSCSLPGGHQILMLDWAEDEDLLFPITVGGKEYPYFIWNLEAAGDPGQKARNCLSPLQRKLLQDFADAPGKAKVIGIHAPPVGPFPDWTDEELRLGRKTYDNKDTARGPMSSVIVKADGSKTKINGHLLFAVAPKNSAGGMEAHYGSFSTDRDSFFTTVANSGVRLVLAGHIHRNGLFVVHAPATKGAAPGQMVFRLVSQTEASGAKPPAVSSTAEGKRGPLYVNTTSSGPRGNYHPRKGQSYYTDPGWAFIELLADGTIKQVRFRPGRGAPRKATAVHREAELRAG